MSRTGQFRLAALIFVALVVAAGAGAYALWSGEPTDGPPPSPATTATEGSTPARGPVVLAISVDGLNPEALTTLGREGAPSFWKLIDEGASTLNARTLHELTTTLPNHTAMLTGRRVNGDGGTSVTFNDDNGETLASTHGDYVPGVFDVAHDSGVRTALFAEKDKFTFLLRSWDERHGAEDTVEDDDGRDKIDDSAVARASQLVPKVRDAVTGGGDAARLVFWHIAGPDVAGHTRGWLGDPYLSAVRDADRAIGSVLTAIESEPSLDGRIAILLTADHGGPRGGNHHDEADQLANHRIPFIAWGGGVRGGVDLYDLNTARRDPDKGRPDYEGPQPVRNADLADTALALLGLPELPDSEIGAALTLQ